MDVPTVVWDPQGTAQWRGCSFESRSSAPYLTPDTGRRWRTIDELDGPATRWRIDRRSGPARGCSRT